MTTKIEWTDEVWNPITGCTQIMEGCKHCYAKRMAQRLKGRCGYPKDDPFKVTLHPDRLDQPLRWKKPRKVFVCSMGDLFHEDVPYDFVQQIWGAMLESPQHVFQVLTKRPERMSDFLARWLAGNIVMKSGKHTSHIWLGCSCSTQKDIDDTIYHILSTPASVRFLSIEPLLENVDIRPSLSNLKNGITKKLDWVIVGGESGPKARPIHPNWVRSIRDQCQAAHVPFFFKQWGSYGPGSINFQTGNKSFRMFENKTQWINKASTWVNGGICVDLTGRILRYGNDFDNAVYPVAIIHYIGKKAAGRELDDKIWNEFPARVE